MLPALVLAGLLALGWAVAGTRPASVEAPHSYPQRLYGDGVRVIQLDVVWVTRASGRAEPPAPEGRFPSPSPLPAPAPPR